MSEWLKVIVGFCSVTAAGGLPNVFISDPKQQIPMLVWPLVGLSEVGCLCILLGSCWLVGEGLNDMAHKILDYRDRRRRAQPVLPPEFRR